MHTCFKKITLEAKIWKNDVWGVFETLNSENLNRKFCLALSELPVLVSFCRFLFFLSPLIFWKVTLSSLKVAKQIKVIISFIKRKENKVDLYNFHSTVWWGIIMKDNFCQLKTLNENLALTTISFCPHQVNSLRENIKILRKKSWIIKSNYGWKIEISR